MAGMGTLIRIALLSLTVMVFFVQDIECELVETGAATGFCQTLVLSRGYRCEEHKVYTEDGFVLLLHRVGILQPSGPKDSPRSNFLAHSSDLKLQLSQVARNREPADFPVEPATDLEQREKSLDYFLESFLFRAQPFQLLFPSEPAVSNNPTVSDQSSLWLGDSKDSPENLPLYLPPWPKSEPPVIVPGSDDGPPSPSPQPSDEREPCSQPPCPSTKTPAHSPSTTNPVSSPLAREPGSVQSPLAHSPDVVNPVLSPFPSEGITENPAIPGTPDIPRIPDIPSIPDVPGIPSVPEIPCVPSIPDVPDVPGIPNIPSIPGVPDIPGPSVSLTPISITPISSDEGQWLPPTAEPLIPVPFPPSPISSGIFPPVATPPSTLPTPERPASASPIQWVPPPPTLPMPGEEASPIWVPPASTPAYPEIIAPEPVPISNIPDADALGNGAAVLLMHPELLNGDSWFKTVHQDVHSPLLPLILTNHGFDVWIGHERATFWGHEHVAMNNSNPEYWSWSWDEHVKYDLPALLRYICSTIQNQVHVVGVSQGAAVAVAAATNPDVGAMMRSLILLGPTTYRGTATQSFMQVWAGVFAEASNVDRPELNDVPGVFNISTVLDIASLSIGGSTSTMSGSDCCINERVVLFDNGWDGTTSLKNLKHFEQCILEDAFQKFDYVVPSRNLEAYGQATPPPYLPGSIRPDLPVLVVSAGQDYFAPSEGIEELLSAMQYRPARVDLPLYSHLDLFFSSTRYEDVYLPICSYLELHSRLPKDLETPVTDLPPGMNGPTPGG